MELQYNGSMKLTTHFHLMQMYMEVLSSLYALACGNILLLYFIITKAQNLI